MGRFTVVCERVDQVIAPMESAKRQKALQHLHGVSLAAAILAKKRNLPAEIAQIAAMLHDLAAYTSGSYENHAMRGGELAKTILVELGVTTEAETAQICQAIARHDDKDRVDTPFDELLKDADVMDHTLHDVTKEIKAKEQTRFASLCKEFGLRE